MVKEITDKFSPEDIVKFAEMIGKWKCTAPEMYNGSKILCSLCRDNSCSSWGPCSKDRKTLEVDLITTYSGSPSIKRLAIEASLDGYKLGKYDSEKHEFLGAEEKVEAIFNEADKQEEKKKQKVSECAENILNQS